ncbi:glycosyltransferase family 2 protein [Metabacillus sp. KIGAM252]|uniref:Glycosyltransferase family 2 protein n=1 Tax=Metabacillus flavus TaxID=2823519 RepID=A0ABS5LJJ2_9BACI|nr:glycosyltransferase family 2 protein [Metabacillus flavus]MBS2970921.1 glycosyltransferase family 2 protein [Metabacillus flavus]
MKISVVVTTYNRLWALAELMECLLRQTLKPHEIIIVNDAGERVDRLQEMYPELPIQIQHLTENGGHVTARNLGVRQATGDAIMLCDDDDLLMPSHLERMSRSLDKADLVYSDAEIVRFKWQRFIRFPQERRLFAYQYDPQNMKRFSTYVPSGSLYKRKLHEEIGYFDLDVHNYWDWDFILRVMKKHIVKRVPVAGVIYSFDGEGDNQSAQLNSVREGFLNIFADKHDLGELEVKNFSTLLEEPEIKSLESSSEIIWDGMPIVSRLAQENSLAK